MARTTTKHLACLKIRTCHRDSVSDNGVGNSPTTVLPASPPTAITEHEPSPLTFDPTISLADTQTAIGDNTAALDPTVSGALIALSILQSTLSSSKTIQPAPAAAESIVVNIGGSDIVFFQLHTEIPGAQSSDPPTHNADPAQTASLLGVLLTASGSNGVLSIGPDVVALIDPSRTTYISLPEATISSLLAGNAHAHDARVSSQPQETEIEVASGTIPATKADPQTSLIGQTTNRFSDSPLTPSSTLVGAQDTSRWPSHAQTILAAGSLTLTADTLLSSLASAALISGAILSAGGVALKLPQSQIVTFAPNGSGLIVVGPSGKTQVLSTISTLSASDKPGTMETAIALPKVVQQSGSVKSGTSDSAGGDSNSAASTATGTGAGKGEVGVDLSSIVGNPAGPDVGMMLVICLFAVLLE
jgi:hypothetical protein